MEIQIDESSLVPVYEQIMTQIFRAILEKQISDGYSLPTIRQLATDLELNNNTVAKAYQLMEVAGMIETNGRKGTILTYHCREKLREYLSRVVHNELKMTILQFKEIGITQSEFKKTFGEVLTEVFSK